jgi:hypothetical protein
MIIFKVSVKKTNRQIKTNCLEAADRFFLFIVTTKIKITLILNNTGKIEFLIETITYVMSARDILYPQIVM